MKGLLLGLLLLLPAAASAQIGLPAGIGQLATAVTSSPTSVSSVVIGSNGLTVTMTLNQAASLNLGSLTPNLDGSAFTLQGSGGTSITSSLTTTQTNDIVVADLQVSFTGGDTAVASISDTAGLTWTTRGTAGDGAGDDVIEFEAKSSAVLVSDVLTITFTHGTAFGSLSEFGASGINFASPFDSHAGLPVILNNNGDPTFSTTSANTMAITGLGFGSTSTPTAGTGWTGIASGQAGSFMLTEFKNFTSAQSGTAVAIGTGNGDQYASVTDALDAAVGTGGFSMSVAGVGDTITWTAPGTPSTTFTGTLSTVVHSGVTVTYSVSTTAFTSPALGSTISGAAVTNNSTQ